jgi:hypothetical protein
LPDKSEPSALRDGIDPAQKVGGMGERASLLVQIVSAVPPSRWNSHLGESAERLLEFAERSEWADPLILAWTRAANRMGDVAWIRALSVRFLASKRLKSWTPDDLPDLDQIPPATAEALLATGLQVGPPDESNPVWTLITRYRRPMGIALGKALLEVVAKRVVAPGNQMYVLAQYLRDLALRVPPEVADVEVAWPEPENMGYLRNAVEEFRATLEFRRELWKEIGS